MSDSWLPPPPLFGDDRPEHEHHHHEQERHVHVHQDYRQHRPDRGVELRDQVRSQYGSGVSVGDILSFLDYRVNELHRAILEPERHASRVPGSPVRMAGIDAVLNADAASFRSAQAVSELGERLDRLEAKLDQLLARLPES